MWSQVSDDQLRKETSSTLEGATGAHPCQRLLTAFPAPTQKRRHCNDLQL